MFQEDDDPLEEEVRQFAEELRRRATDLVEELALIGVHIHQQGLMIAHVDDGTVAPLVVLDGVIGRLAFSERVQQPEQERFDEAFAEVADSIVDDDYQRAREELLRRLRDES